MSRLYSESRRIVRGAAHRLAAGVASLERMSAAPRIVVYYAWPDFARKCDAFADLFRARGYPTIVRTGTSLYDRIRIRDSRDLHVGFWNEYPSAFMPSKFIFFNAEPLHADTWSGGSERFALMRDAVEVWDYSAANLDIHQARGHRVRLVPFGYAPHYERKFAASMADRAPEIDIDVLFVGSISERRRKVLEQLRETGIRLVTVTPESPQYGKELDRTIARSKIILSLFYHDEPRAHIADFARLDHLLANRRFIVHERLPDFCADPDFEQAVVTTPYTELVSTCLHFLAHDADRMQRATACYEWFRTSRAMDDCIPYETLERSWRP